MRKELDCSFLLNQFRAGCHRSEACQILAQNGMIQQEGEMLYSTVKKALKVSVQIEFSCEPFH